MLQILRVRNLGVIADATLEPDDGFTVITGETGAGKTLLLGAIRLLSGAEANPEAVGPFGEEAHVDGLFTSADGEERGAARVVPRSGRSRALLNGTLSSVAALTSTIGADIEIIGQHDQMSLTRRGAIRQLIDAGLDAAGTSARDAYQTQWRRFQTASAMVETLGGDRHALERERDLALYQAEEIAASGFSPGDEERIRAEALRLANIETLRLLTSESVEALDRVSDDLGVAIAALRKATSADPEVAGLTSELEGLADSLASTGSAARHYADQLESDPIGLESAEEKLSILADLKRKYGDDIEEILAFAETTSRRAEELHDLLEGAATAASELEASRVALLDAASKLRAVRIEAGARLAESVRAHLIELGFADPAVEFSITETDLGPTGGDDTSLLFASDARLATGEVSAVASGGELSRLVLAVRLAAGVSAARALIFDEVDTGVGGSTALALGRKLASLAVHQQLLCVTHLPQVAAFASRHYTIERRENAATLRLVEGDDRIAELTRMLAGLPESEKGRRAAEELLALVRR